MLQLPSKARHFSRAQIAEITRGGKATVKVKPVKDPLIALVAKADAALDRYYNAVFKAYDAKGKLPKDDREYAVVYIPDELLNVEWSNGFPFTSEKHIDEQFRRAIVRARQRLSDSEKRLRDYRPGHGFFNLKIELEQSVNSAKRALKLFRKCRQPLKDEFRKENIRLLKIQNRVGLVAARREVRAEFEALKKITKQIANTKPSTAAGALAVAQYVEKRLWSDRPRMFSDDGSLPGNFGSLMRAALAVISSEVTTPQS